jgi:gas vesicle protein
MSTSSKVLFAALSGVAIGAAIGILFAPDKGSETRKKVSDAAKDFTDKASQKMKEGMKMASGFRSKVNDESEDFAV